MRAAPTTMTAMAAPTLAISRARARGTLPCSHRKLTSTLRVFCSMKTMSTTRVNAAAHTANQVALILVLGGNPGNAGGEDVAAPIGVMPPGSTDGETGGGSDPLT